MAMGATEDGAAATTGNSSTMAVGGAKFSTTKEIRDGGRSDTTKLIAKGKSYLSYFYVGVCSSVLYLPHDAPNDILLFNNSVASSSKNYDDTTPIVLEIYYHKPGRAIDFQWATTKFIDANLHDNQTINDLPPDIQSQIMQFNELYQNVRAGDRYTLQYIAKVGIQLLLNDVLLGTVGVDMSMRQQRELARIIYSVWFGTKSPFSESMKNELLTPLHVDVVDSVKGAQSTKEDAPLVFTSTLSGGNNGILATDSNVNAANVMTEEESKLLQSLGILDMLVEESDAKAKQRSEAISAKESQTEQTTETQLKSRNDTVAASAWWSRIRHWVIPPRYAQNSVQVQQKTSYESQSSAELAIHDQKSVQTIHTINNNDRKDSDSDDQSGYSPILLGIGGTLFLLPHLAILLSLPPVLRRRGAPYLPTFGNKLNIMFDLIRNHTMHSRSIQQANSNAKTQQPLKFVDLGSGDGRVVFRAARSGLFTKSIGYEINPALHIFANFRKLVTPKYWNSTSFYMRDLWKIELDQYNVVTVYGLGPIMEKLGTKLEAEMKPGSIVVSNVFQIPGWRASSGGNGVYLYQVPDCFERRNKTNQEIETNDK